MVNCLARTQHDHQPSDHASFDFLIEKNLIEKTSNMNISDFTLSESSYMEPATSLLL